MPPRLVDPAKIHAALQLLGLDKAWMRLVACSPATQEQAKTLLDQFKHEQLRPAYQALALQHHPDRGGDEAMMKELSAAYELVKSLTVLARPRGVRGRATAQSYNPPTRRVVVIRVDVRGGATTTGTGSSCTGGAWWTSASRTRTTSD